MKKARILVIIAFMVSKLTAQVDFQSPNAASFEKYGFVPVSTYTGIPQIEIPIYGIKVSDINMPISLSYHASGIRIEEIASWVGLGWNLNIGGVITRQVKGYPDFMYDMLPQSALNKLIENNTILSEDILFQKNEPIYKYDGEPDIFTYNFNGYVGQFVIDQNTNQYYDLTKNTNLKIKYNNGSDGFVIITPDGIQYTFNDKEKQKVYSRSGNGYNMTDALSEAEFSLQSDRNDYVSAWFLSEIKSLNTNQTISFSYSPVDNYFIERSEPTGYALFPEDEVNLSTTNNYWSQSKIYQYNIRNSKITTSNNINITFNTEDRLDIESGDEALTQINILYGTDTIKVYKFFHDYFCVDGKTIAEAKENELRLKLTSFCERGKNNYIFSYNEDYDLPARISNYYSDYLLGSYSKDFLGYHNNQNIAQYLTGYTGNYTQIREDVYYSTTGGIDHKDSTTFEATINESGANREPNLAYCETYTLSKIVYPTGGSSEFEYQLHNYSYIGDNDEGENKSFPGLRIYKIITNDNNGNTNYRTFSYNELNEDYAETTKSSGTLVRDPMFISEVFAQGVKSMGETSEEGIKALYTNRSYLRLSSNSATGIYDFSGGFIGYNTVREDLNGNGYKITKYYTANNNSSNDEYESTVGYFSYVPTYEDILYFPISECNSIFSEGWKSPAYKRGLINLEIILNDDLEPVKKVSYNYNFAGQNNILYGVERKQYGTYEYWTNLYCYSSGYSQLASKCIEELYPGSAQSISDTMTYAYDDYNQASAISTLSTNGDVLKTFNTYPYNLTGEVYDTMVNKNILSPVIKSENWNKTKEVSSKTGAIYYDSTHIKTIQKTYGLWGDNNMPLPVKIAEYSGDDPNSGERITIIDNYDTNGNILQYHQKDNISVSYLWGYSNTYPIAKAVNAEYKEIYFDSFEEVKEWEFSDFTGESWCTNYEYYRNYSSTKAHTGKKSIRLSASSSEHVLKTPQLAVNNSDSTKYKMTCYVYTTLPDAYIILYYNATENPYNYVDYNSSSVIMTPNEWTFLEVELEVPSNAKYIFGELAASQNDGDVYFDEVRIYPSGAQMTTYTYEPLIGISSQTDERGRTISYEYDSFGRLYRIIDNEGNVLKQYDYNYAQ